MTETPPRKLAPWKRALGVLAFTVVVLVSAVGGYLLVQGSGPADAVPEPAAPVLLTSLVWFVFGFLFFGGGIFVYVVVLVTNGLTFDFSKPFWPAQKVKLWVSAIAVLVLLGVGLGLFGNAVLGPILSGLGLPPPLPRLVPLIGALLLAQLALMWLNPWAPLEKSGIRRRLASYGVAGRDLESGWAVGISDPTKSTYKKLTYVEEDLGMLWFLGDRLVYRGDSQSFEVRRDDLLDVERVADSGNVQAYGGVVHVILRFVGEDGDERRVRLHALGCWHTGAVKKAVEALAARLAAWRRPLPAPAPVR